MSQVYMYMVACTGIIALFYMAGLPVGASGFFTFIGTDIDSTSDISSGTFFSSIIAIFGIGAVAAIVIGFFAKANAETFIIGSLCAGILTTITGTFVSILLYTKDMGFVYYLAYLLFVPLITGFFIAIISYWRGTG